MNQQLEKIYQIFLKNKSVQTDSRKVKKGDIFFTVSGENFNANEFVKEALEKGADLVVLDDENFFDPKNPKMILVESGLKMLQELAKRYRADLKIPFLGITGSNGKTTTKELTREVLSQKYNVLATTGNLNNQIGVPLTILSIKSKHDFAIIEMGASHAGEIKELVEIARPDFGIIINISNAHIGEFGSYENIVKTKMALYDFLEQNNGWKFDYCIPVEVLVDNLFLEVEIFGETVKTNLVGCYNNENIGIAVEIGRYFQIEEEKIRKAIAKYQPKNNRSQFLKTKKENNVFLDAYNANPASMKLSLQSFFNKEIANKILIIGDMKELGQYSEEEHKIILDLIKKNKIEKTYIVGPEFFIFKNKYDFDFFETRKDLMEFLKKDKIKNKNILIKASRGIGLEEIVERKLI